jgi:hypothetical protein
MTSCDHCGAAFEPDPMVMALQRMVPNRTPMQRHGEDGLLFHGPVLCDNCRGLPPQQLAEIIYEFLDRKFFSQ